MQASTADLFVLERETSIWRRHPWPEVHGLAEGVAAWLLDRDELGAVGLVGDSTVELVAALQGAWLAGAAVSVLPGPIRGADDRRWAEATMNRFTSIGVRTVLSNGAYLVHLQDHLADMDPMGVEIADVVTAAHTKRSISGGPINTDRPAVLQGTAGSTGAPRTGRPLTGSGARATSEGSMSAWGWRRPTSVAPGCPSTTTWVSPFCSAER